MNKSFIALLVFVALSSRHTSVAQSRFYRLNQLEVDRAKATLGKQCRAYASSVATPEKKNKADKKTIAFLNEFYNNHLSVDELIKKADPFMPSAWKFKTTDLGGAVKYETQIRSDGNIQASILFTVFLNEIVFKRIYFSTGSKTSCTGSAINYVEPVDINYLDLFCLSLIDFPISFFAQSGLVECDATSYEKLIGVAFAGYKLPSADSLYINKVLWNEDDKYVANKIAPCFLTFTDNHNTYILYQLLYAPNHIAAIYSFESLTYLQVAGIAKHPAYILQKMEEIQHSPIKIRWQQNDVVKDGLTYKDLNISQENMLLKFKTRQ